jgi:hypothetical protein
MAQPLPEQDAAFAVLAQLQAANETVLRMQTALARLTVVLTEMTRLRRMQEEVLVDLGNLNAECPELAELRLKAKCVHEYLCATHQTALETLRPLFGAGED